MAVVIEADPDTIVYRRDNDLSRTRPKQTASQVEREQNDYGSYMKNLLSKFNFELVCVDNSGPLDPTVQRINQILYSYENNLRLATPPEPSQI